MMDFFGGFSASKLKPQLKMAVSRIQMASNKKAALLKQNMREVAVMLAEDQPKEEKAKIRAEALIRDDNLIEAYEILQLECELLSERIKLIDFQKDCPSDLVTVVSTLMWASHRVDIPELQAIRKQFRAKYGKKFEEAAMNNTGGVLNERVVTKLSVDPPAAYLVQTYLERICEQFEVDWTPKMKLSAEQMVEPMAAPVGYSVQVAQGTGLGVGGNTTTEAMTGTLNADEEIGHAKQNGGIPPPVATATPLTPAGSGGGEAPPPPVVTATPYEPPPPSNNSIPPPAPGNSNKNDFEEVDIFVPPTAPLGTPGVSTLDTETKPGDGGDKNGDDDDDDDNNIGSGEGSAAPPPSSATESFADLAARFDALKK